MHIDRAAFIVLTATLAGCRPTSPEAQTTQTVPIAPSVSASANANANAGANTNADPPTSETLSFPEARRYLERRVSAHTCNEPETRKPARAEGHITIHTGPANECDELLARVVRTPPAPTCEALGITMWCKPEIGRLTVEAGRRAVRCLSSKSRAPAICEEHVVSACVAAAIDETAPSPEAKPACAPIVDACRRKGTPLAVGDCERYLTSLRYCSAIELAIGCLGASCSSRTCVAAREDL